MAKGKIEIDTYVSLIDGVVDVAVYAGDESEPSISQTFTFEQMMLDVVETHSVPAKPRYMADEHVKDAAEELSLLKINFEIAYAVAMEEIRKRRTNAP